MAGKNNETKRKIRIIDEESSNHEGEDTIDNDGVEELIKPDTDKMRTVQDLSSCTSIAKVFSTLDSRSGFWQIKGDWVLPYFTLQQPIKNFQQPIWKVKVSPDALWNHLWIWFLSAHDGIVVCWVSLFNNSG